MSTTVLIVGAGPVGLTVASELTRYRIDVRIVDAVSARTDKSKALILWSRTLELLDRGGVAGAKPFVEAGFKLGAFTMMRGDQMIGRVSMDAIPSTHAYALAIPQSETERLLEERLSAMGVSVQRSTQATEFTFGPDGVAATLIAADGGREEVQAGWLIGCDGAHSAVRHALGAPFAGETLLSDWFLADVHMTGYPRPDTEGTIYWHDEGVLLIVPIRPGRYRIIGDLPATTAKVPSAPALEQVQAIVDKRGPASTWLSDPIWLSGFRINGRKVAHYRYGRTFLAGDAAHVHSPAGGQGMNTGMQDAVNLAWKLAMVVRGEVREELLDSYSPERSQVGNEVLEAAGRLTAVATLKNPIAQHVRNVVGRLLLGIPQFVHAMADQMAEVSIHYADSPLNGPDAGTGLRSGNRVPDTDDTPVGAGHAPRFALRGDAGPPLDAIVRQFGSIVDPVIRPPLSEGVVSLVRPDGYLACSARNAEVVANYLRSLASVTGPSTVT